MSSKSNKPTCYITPIRKVQKADTQLVASAPMEWEDEFVGLYEARQAIIPPPFNPLQLKALVQQNNTLPLCIDAMEEGVDGTGHEIRLIPGKKENPKEEDRLSGFFDEPWPGMSMVTIRKQLRNDLESIGYAFMEVVTNNAGEVVLLRALDATTMRLLRLSNPYTITKEVIRGGERTKVAIQHRVRRFVQKIGTKLVYYKEFGVPLDVDKDTGEIVTKRLPPTKRASQIIYFTVHKDTKTPYGVPRWISQLPSVLGSRKAEIFNLEFFDSGGLPPVVVFVQGGVLTSEVRSQLENYLSGKVANKHRGVVVEAQSSTGSLDSAGSVKVSVERFGDARLSDSMFQNYDKSCAEHIRQAFRLPPIFIGRTSEYNFATARAAYLVAESQVFSSERFEFDEIINRTICRALGAENYEFQSLPLTIVDIDAKLKAMGDFQDSVDPKSLVNTVNDLTGLSLIYKDQGGGSSSATPDRRSPDRGSPDQAQPAQDQAAGTPGHGTPGHGTPAQDAQASNAQASNNQVQKGDVNPGALNPGDLIDLVDSWLVVYGLEDGFTTLSKEEVDSRVESLTPQQLQVFNRLLASRTVGTTTYEGVVDIVGCCHDNEF